MATINYENKEALNVNPTIPNKNKVVDSDMNLIKQVGNQILTTMGVYTDTWSSSATYNVDEIAIYDNRIFKNLTGTNTATTPDQDTTNWQETTLASMSGGGGGGVTGDTLPIGSIMPYGSATAPANWLVCDGSAVSRTTYANLFAVIGTSFGSGDGSTTFNLPNLKGRVAVGQDTSDTDFDAMGETGGSKDAVVVSHDHNNTNNAISWVGNAGLGNTNWLAADGKQVTYSTIANPNDGAKAGWMGNANKVVSSSGVSGTGKNLQPYQVVCYIIKADQSAGLVANVSKTYSTSEDDTYGCDYENKHFGGVELYSGTTAGNITLSESAANYSAIEIFYKSSDSVYLNTGKIYSPNGKNVGLYAPYSIGTTCYSKLAQVNINGTALTMSNEIETQLWASNEKVAINTPAGGNHYFTIEKVIGYK